MSQPSSSAIPRAAQESSAPAIPELTLTLRSGAVDGELLLPAGEHVIECATWVPGAYAFLRYGRDLTHVRDAEDHPLARASYTGFHASGLVRFTAVLADPAWTELAGLITSEYAVVHVTRVPMLRGYTGPVRVHWRLPEGWHAHHPEGGEREHDHTFVYPSFAVLLDTPVIAGAFTEILREEQGSTFSHVFLDRAVGHDTELEGFVDDVQKLARACREVFGSFPFSRYTFVWGLDPRAQWGLEHAFATLVGIGPLALVEPEARFVALRVGVHELFHAWNVCRLKPRALTKLDLVNGSFPGELWIAEGFTRYYEFLLMVRAGLCSPERFFSNIINYYSALRERPAYDHTSPVDSSCATFLNHTRYPNSPNATINYYDAGMLVAFDLDAQLQRQGRSLDQAVRALYEGYAEAPDGYDNEQAFALFERFGVDARAEAAQAGALSTEAQLEALGFVIERHEVAKLGVVLDTSDSERGARVVHVLRDSAAERAGICAEDRILTQDGIAFAPKALDWLTRNRKVCELTLRRGDRHLPCQVQPEPVSEIKQLRFEGDPAVLERWLGQRLERGPIALDRFDNFAGNERVV